MAIKPLRPCKKPGCGKLTKESYCEAHRSLVKKAPRRESAEWHNWYNLPIWKDSLRPAQLIGDPFCAVCRKAGQRTRATVVDHVIPFRGDWDLFVDPKNHQSLCKRHHDQKTAKEQAERKKNGQRFVSV